MAVIMRQVAVAVQAAVVLTELHGKAVKVVVARIMLFFLETLALAVQVVKTVLILTHPLGGIKVDTVADTEHKIVLRAVQALLILEQVVVVVDSHPTDPAVPVEADL